MELCYLEAHSQKIYISKRNGHRSIKRIIKTKNLDKLSNPLEFDVNIDGLPITDSSKTELWPIQCKLFSTKYKFRPFNVGIYLGNTKPPLQIYFEDFVNEILKLMREGYTCNIRKFDIRIKVFIAYLPARSFMLNIIGSTGYYTCNKCTQ
jgi:hypothetical protein